MSWEYVATMCSCVRLLAIAASVATSDVCAVASTSNKVDGVEQESLSGTAGQDAEPAPSDVSISGVCACCAVCGSAQPGLDGGAPWAFSFD